MSKWLNRLIPRSKEMAKEQKKSEEDNLEASMEQATAMNMAIQSAVTVADISHVNYRNGFSVALGNAFAKKGII